MHRTEITTVLWTTEPVTEADLKAHLKGMRSKGKIEVSDIELKARGLTAPVIAAKMLQEGLKPASLGLDKKGRPLPPQKTNGV